MIVPLRSQLPEFYGQILPGPADSLVWSDSAKWLTYFTVPSPFQIRFLYGGKPTTRIAMNRDMVAPFAAALANIEENRLLNHIASYDGCFNIRQTRGQDTISTHAYGLAIDLNAKDNPLGSAGTMYPGLIKCFTDADFVWGGSFKDRPDPMHFQYVIEG